MKSSDIPSSRTSRITSASSLFVSLYLVLLAFFIMLNTISKIQQKGKDEAMGSIQETFSDSDIKQDFIFIEDVNPTGAEVSSESYFAPVGKVANDILKIMDAGVVQSGNTMTITLPKDEFFVPDSARISRKQDKFLSRLTDELDKTRSGIKVDIEFRMGIMIGDASPASDPNAKSNLGIARAGVFARRLAELGVEQSSIFVGISPDEPDLVKIIFHERPVDDPEAKPYFLE